MGKFGRGLEKVINTVGTIIVIALMLFILLLTVFGEFF